MYSLFIYDIYDRYVILDVLQLAELNAAKTVTGLPERHPTSSVWLSSVRTCVVKAFTAFFIMDASQVWECDFILKKT